jgi:photosystem II stability/assembly factor-like uncharacterized protein
MAALVEMPSARLNAENGPLDTPTGMVRFYFHALGTGQCDLAFKFAGQRSKSLSAFRRSCRAIRSIVIERLSNPGYRLHPQTAVYTCLAVRYTIYRRSGATTFGGWYLMEKTPLVFWHMLLSRSHFTVGGKAAAPARATCVAAIPSYAQPSSAQRIIGSAFLSASAGWITVSQSGAYVPNGSCAHGIGTNCDTAQTVIYRTDDAGAHWRSLLSLTTSRSPLVWIRLFTRSNALVSADVGSQGRDMLFGTSDGGRTWRRSVLPAGYFPDPPTITFPDTQHGWVYIGGGAMGSMGVTIFRTDDGGKRWTQVACTSVQFAPRACHSHSGIPFGGDKEFITFANDRSGWLTVVSNAGTPSLLHSSDGGHTWHDQHVGLPPSVQPPGAASTVYPMGTLDEPHIFGNIGVLAEAVGFYRPKPRASWSRLYLYRSADAGASWHFYQRTPLPAPTIAQYASGEGSLTQFLDIRHWIAVSGNVIWRTANAGETWSHEAMHSPARLQLVSLAFADSSHGWAEAAPQGQTGGMLGGTTILRTSDGGRHWSRVAVP